MDSLLQMWYNSPQYKQCPGGACNTPGRDMTDVTGHVGMIVTSNLLVYQRSGGFLMRKIDAERNRAYTTLHRAVDAGKLVKPDTCQLCGRNCQHIRIGGHHYKGYNYPLDVWWVCQRCNGLLEFRHDDSLTLEAARHLVTASGLVGFCKKCFSNRPRTAVLVRHRG